MKKITWGLLLAWVSFSMGAVDEDSSAWHRAKAKPLTHRVDRVTAYSDSARVTRIATVRVGKGKEWVVIPGLPQTVNPSSLQVRLNGVPGGRISQVLMEEAYEKVALKPQLEAKLTQLRSHYGTMLDLGQQERLLQDRQNFLRQLSLEAPFTKSTPPNAFRPFQAGAATLGAALESTHAARLDVTTDEIRLRARQREVQEKIDLLQREISGVTDRGDQKWVRHLYLLIDSPSAQSGAVEVTYHLNGALWRPLYDIRADLDRKSSAGSIKLVAAGMVEQHTGEDWEKVRLTLSTKDPVALYLPKLTRWTLGEVREEQSAKDANRSLGARGMMNERRKVVMHDMAPQAPAAQPAGKMRDRRDTQAEAESDESSLAVDALEEQSAGASAGVAAPAPPAESAPARTYNLAKRQAYENTKEKADSSTGTLFPLARLETLYPPLDNLNRSIASLDGAAQQARPVEMTGGQVRTSPQVSDESLPVALAKGRLIELSSPFLVDVKNDAPAYKIPLVSQALQAELSYFAVPKVETAVYLRATTTNSTDYPILGGNAQVFMDGDLVSRTQLATIDEGGHFTVDLGSDRNVEVKRLVEKRSRTEGLISKDHITEVEVKIEVANRHGFPITLDLRDQHPLSPNERIKVKLAKVAPEIKPADDGTLQWAAKIPGGGKKQFIFTYWVTHPENFLISELN